MMTDLTHTPSWTVPATARTVSKSPRLKGRSRPLTSLAILSASVVATGVIGAIIHMDQRTEVFHQLERESLLVTAAVTGQRGQLASPEIIDAFPRIQADSAIVGGILYDGDGTIIARFGEQVQELDSGTTARYDNGTKRYVFQVDPADPAPTHRLLLALDGSQPMATLRARTLKIGGGILLTLLLAGLTVQGLLWSRIVAPLNALSRQFRLALEEPDGAGRWIQEDPRGPALDDITHSANELLSVTAESHRRDMSAVFAHVHGAPVATVALDKGGNMVFCNLSARRLLGDANTAPSAVPAPTITLDEQGDPLDLASWVSTRGFSQGFLHLADGPRPCLFASRKQRGRLGQSGWVFVDMIEQEAGAVTPAAPPVDTTLETEVTNLRASLNQCLVLLDSYQAAEDTYRPLPVDLGRATREWRDGCDASTRALVTMDPLPPVLGEPEEMTELTGQILDLLRQHQPHPTARIHVDHETQSEPTAPGRYRFSIALPAPIALDTADQPVQGQHGKTRRALGLAIIHRLVERAGGTVADIKLDMDGGSITLLMPMAKAAPKPEECRFDDLDRL